MSSIATCGTPRRALWIAFLAATFLVAERPSDAAPSCKRFSVQRTRKSKGSGTEGGQRDSGWRGKAKQKLRGLRRPGKSTRGRQNRVQKLNRMWKKRVVGTDRFAPLEGKNLSQAKQGLVRLLTRELFQKHGRGGKGRVYRLSSIARLDSPTSNPLTGRDNFLVITMKNPRSKAALSRAIQGVSPTARRKLVVKVNDAAALAKIADAKNGSTLEGDSIQEAIDKNAIEVIDDAPDAAIYRLANKLGGRGTIKRLASDLRTSRGARGDTRDNVILGAAAGAALPAVLSPEPISKIVIGSVLVRRGVRAVRGVHRAIQRRNAALTTYNKILRDSYVADFSNKGAPVLRKANARLAEGLPDTISSVAEAHATYRDYVQALNKGAAAEQGGVQGAAHTSTFELPDFVGHFSKLSFEKASK